MSGNHTISMASLVRQLHYFKGVHGSAIHRPLTGVLGPAIHRHFAADLESNRPLAASRKQLRKRKAFFGRRSQARREREAGRLLRLRRLRRKRRKHFHEKRKKEKKKSFLFRPFFFFVILLLAWNENDVTKIKVVAASMPKTKIGFQ
jgi:hypothetical protein